MRVEAVEQRPVCCPAGCWLIDNDDVDTAQPRLPPERLPNDSFQPVPACTQPTVFLAYGETQSWLVCAVGRKKQGEHFVAATFWFCEDATEGSFVGEPVLSPEATVVRGAVRRLVCRGRIVFGDNVKRNALRRQLGAPFGATTFQNQATGFSCHPRPESMCASPLDLAGLKCTFHLSAT